MPEHLASHSGNYLLLSHSHFVWCIITRVARTISDDQSFFSSLEKPDTKSFVTLAYGYKSHIMGEGSVPLNPNCYVSSAFYIPEFPMHLLLVSQVVKQLNCKITFFFIRLCILGSGIWENDKWRS